MLALRMENTDPKPTRRVRYSGTHPKTFKEKYKELQPDKYAADIEKVIAQGRTPAGMHLSICVKEILSVLQIQSGETGLDATLGYGGHTQELLQAVAPNGKVFAIDVDPIELPKTKSRLQALGYDETKLSIRKLNFSSIELIVYESGLLDFILADLGVSSMQIDNPDRGFSLKVDGPLDLRLNPSSGKSAAAFLLGIAVDDLCELLQVNSDEPHAKLIAAAIVDRMKRGAVIATTGHLKAIITETLQFLPKKDREEAIRKSCQRCFQALRIEVNNEFTVLDKFLAKLPDALAEGGRVAILTFHSGEDRRVKKSFQNFFRDGIYSAIAEQPERATLAEINVNPRARSAKLRWAIRK